MRAVMLAALAGCSFGARAASSDGADGAVPGDARGDATPAHCLASGACRRKPITATHVTGGPHADYVMLVSLASDPDLTGRTGPELEFTDASGAPLAYERVRFAPANGALIAWVRVPSLAMGTTIYLWWGGTDGTDHQDRARTWAAGYAGVWHLDETAGTSLADATGNANTASATNGATVGATGWIGQGVAFDGTNDYLAVTQSPSLMATTGSATFALWINWTSLTSSHYQRILCSSNRFTNSGDGYEWASQPQGGHYIYPWGGDEDYNFGPTPFVAGTWQYAVATLDFSTKTVAIYVDATAMTFSDTYAPTLWTTPGAPGDWLWGSNISTSGSFGGYMDEIRVMNGVRSPEWVATSFANQKDPGSFATVGPAETALP